MFALKRDPGDRDHRFSQFEVAYRGNRPVGQTLKTTIFKTESGIMLGMPKADIVARLGTCFEIALADGEIGLEQIYYQDRDRKSRFLKQYRAKGYFAEFEFSRDHLVRFRFGFDE